MGLRDEGPAFAFEFCFKLVIPTERSRACPERSEREGPLRMRPMPDSSRCLCICFLPLPLHLTLLLKSDRLHPQQNLHSLRMLLRKRTMNLSRLTTPGHIIFSLAIISLGVETILCRHSSVSLYPPQEPPK